MSPASARALPPWSRRLSAALGLLLLAAPLAAPGAAQAAAGHGAAAASVEAGSVLRQSDGRGPRADRGLAEGVDNWWFDAMGLAKIQRRTIGEGVKVAVIDSQIWPDAPDLAGIDLTIHQSCVPDPSVDDPKRGSHGAAMVATLAGQGTRSDGAPGLRGVAPGVEVHYYGHRYLPDAVRRNCISKQVIAAVDEGVDIITISQFWWSDPAVQERSIAYAADAGVVIVQAAGNAQTSRTMRDDGVKPGVVLVTQVDRDGVPQGNVEPVLSTIDPVWNAVAAPGWEATGGGWVPGQGWVSDAEFSGTSNAAPVVAGQLALQKSVYPDATANQLIQSLIHDTSNTEWEWLRGYGFGIAAITAMIKRDPAGWPDVNPLIGTLPEEVLNEYPPEIYGTDEAATAGDPEPSSEAAADSSPTPSATAPAATSPAAADPGALGGSSSDSTQAATENGAPGWLWLLAALSFVLLLGLGVLLARRRVDTSSPGKG